MISSLTRSFRPLFVFPCRLFSTSSSSSDSSNASSSSSSTPQNSKSRPLFLPDDAPESNSRYIDPVSSLVRAVRGLRQQVVTPEGAPMRRIPTTIEEQNAIDPAIIDYFSKLDIEPEPKPELPFEDIEKPRVRVRMQTRKAVPMSGRLTELQLCRLLALRAYNQQLWTIEALSEGFDISKDQCEILLNSYSCPLLTPGLYENRVAPVAKLHLSEIPKQFQEIQKHVVQGEQLIKTFKQ
jgi:hypothetical protein